MQNFTFSALSRPSGPKFSLTRQKPCLQFWDTVRADFRSVFWSTVRKPCQAQRVSSWLPTKFQRNFDENSVKTRGKLELRTAALRMAVRMSLVVKPSSGSTFLICLAKVSWNIYRILAPPFLFLYQFFSYLFFRYFDLFGWWNLISCCS